MAHIADINQKGVTMTALGCIHIENPCPVLCGPDMPAGSRGSTAPSSSLIDLA